MTIEKEEKGVEQTRKILVAIRFNNDSKELLGWGLVKVAQPEDPVVALHVYSTSEDSEKQKLLLDDYIEIYRNLCDIKRVKLARHIVTGKSIRKSLVKEANESSASALIVGPSKLGSIGFLYIEEAIASNIRGQRIPSGASYSLCLSKSFDIWLV